MSITLYWVLQEAVMNKEKYRLTRENINDSKKRQSLVQLIIHKHIYTHPGKYTYACEVIILFFYY